MTPGKVRAAAERLTQFHERTKPRIMPTSM
jgi:hypothetical protein